MQEILLNLLIFLPLLAVFVNISLNDKHKLFTASIMFVELLISLYLFSTYNYTEGKVSFASSIPIASSFGINYSVGLDGISLILVLLTSIIGFLTTIYSREKEKGIFASISGLVFTMIGLFASFDLILFYIFWELSLIPVLYLIGVHGKDKRIYTSIKYLVYMFSGSMFMLVGILYVSKLYALQTGHWSFNILELTYLHLSYNEQFFAFILFFIAFAFKGAIFPFHTWIPTVYRKSPIEGTLLIATVMSKMGYYGILRILLTLSPDVMVNNIYLLSTLAIIMIIYAGFIAFNKGNMQNIIAYSSISHLGVLLLGLISFSIEGIGGAVFFMFAHGIISFGSFVVIDIIESRYKTTNIYELGGIASNFPTLGTMFGIILMASLGLPLTIGFVGEFLSLIGFFNVSFILTIVAGSTLFIGAIYMLNLNRIAFFGEAKNSNIKYSLDRRESFVLLFLIFLILYLGIYPEVLIKEFNTTIISMLHVIDSETVLENTKKLIYFGTVNKGSF